MAAVVCVGSSGAGKSSTVRRMTGQQRAKSSAGFERETQNCQIFWPKDENNNTAWVDTVGFEQESSASSFQELLRLLRSHKLTSIKAVIWNVIPNVRRDAAFSHQARLIDSLAPGQIWPYVVIVGKQCLCPERELLGAVKAAEMFLVEQEQAEAVVSVLGYRFIEDQSISDEQRDKLLRDKEARRLFNVKTSSEVSSLLSSTLESLPSPLQLDFRVFKCEDCGAVEDPRLMPLFCHLQAVLVHPGQVRLAHPSGLERYHLSEEHFRGHEGKLQRTWLDILLGRGQRYTCCKAKPGKIGCVLKWKCCHRRVESIILTAEDAGCAQRYRCCQGEVNSQGCRLLFQCCDAEQGALGCVKKCVKCGAPWGSPTNDCTRRDVHNVLPYVEEESEEEGEEKSEKEREEMQTKTSIFDNLPPIIIARPF